jgi:hypothetical protein
VIGTFIASLVPGVIHTYLTLDGSLTPWWTKIIIGLQKLLGTQHDFFRWVRPAVESEQPGTQPP